MKEYPRTIASATGARAKHSGFRNHAAATNIPAENAQNAAAAGTDTAPEGISRRAVRGFTASTSRSTIRLNAIAEERAPTIATRIQRIVPAFGKPPAASTAERRAKGSAKIV